MKQMHLLLILAAMNYPLWELHTSLPAGQRQSTVLVSLMADQLLMHYHHQHHLVAVDVGRSVPQDSLTTHCYYQALWSNISAQNFAFSPTSPQIVSATDKFTEMMYKLRSKHNRHFETVKLTQAVTLIFIDFWHAMHSLK